MNFTAIVNRLEQLGEILPVLVAGVSDDDARWRPESGNWSVLEIVCHLADEEVEDFRARTKMTLENPRQAWPSIEPERTAIERDYNAQDLRTATETFVKERKRSVEWLRSLENPEWETAYHHPQAGLVAAGQLLASWVAHDQLHLRQIAKRFYELSGRDAAPYKNDYAGAWS